MVNIVVTLMMPHCTNRDISQEHAYPVPFRATAGNIPDENASAVTADRR
jgi:hypothetical protein